MSEVKIKYSELSTERSEKLEYVMKEIIKEINYQDNKWGLYKKHTIPNWLLIMEDELSKAKTAWCKNIDTQRHTSLEEIKQVVAVGLQCLMAHGIKGN